ncbi:MAG TPA: hypothetical protein VF517_17865 [Thermoleophilaceae bacterium]|jgi:hypothetical protein
MTTLRILVGALLVSTAIHYTDNWLSIEHYAPREGFVAENPGLVPVAWVLFTVLGIAAYREYRRAPSLRAHLMLAGYSLAGITTFAHLLYEGNDFAAWQWASVLADGITGSAVLGFALWSAARVRPAATVA